MKKIGILFLMMTTSSVFASATNSGWTQVSWMGWGLASKYKNQNSETDKEISGNREMRLNSSLFHSSADYTIHSTHWNLKIQADLFASSGSKLTFYAGKNLYIETRYAGISFALGRIEEDTKRFSFRDWIDGTDGVVIRSDFGDKGRIRVDLFDFYTGYSLFEKDGFKNSILNTKQNHFDTKTEIGDFKSNPNEFRNRYRGGIVYHFDSEFFEAALKFQYLNFQNWGRYANDLGIENVSSGDKDYITHSTLELNGKWSWFRCFFSGILARGQDKTNWNQNRSASAIPISGEAVLVSLGISARGWSLDGFAFLPDRDRRNEQGEILELGFIGIGTAPSPVLTTTQSLDFYPSAWITDRGLEKQFSLQSGKRQSAWTGLNLEYKETVQRFRFYFASYFYLSESGNSGSLTMSKDSFQKGYFREILFQYLTYLPSEDERFSFSFLKVSLGSWMSDPSFGQREVFFQIQSGIVL
ncbi:hypothetical protein AB3N59_08995 [Leptospira sp. WS92.C1]